MNDAKIARLYREQLYQVVDEHRNELMAHVRDFLDATEQSTQSLIQIGHYEQTALGEFQLIGDNVKFGNVLIRKSESELGESSEVKIPLYEGMPVYVKGLSGGCPAEGVTAATTGGNAGQDTTGLLTQPRGEAPRHHSEEAK